MAMSDEPNGGIIEGIVWSPGPERGHASEAAEILGKLSGRIEAAWFETGRLCPHCGIGHLAVRSMNRPDEYSCGHLGLTALLTVRDHAQAVEDERRRVRARTAQIIAAARA